MIAVAWCHEHENPAPSGAVFCPYVFWLELNYGPAMAKEAADSCRMDSAVLDV